MHSYTPFLISSSKACSTANTPTDAQLITRAPRAGRMYLQCTPGGAACPGSLECLPAQDGNNYCQCGKEAQCSGKGYCGTQFIPGLGIYLQQCGVRRLVEHDDFCAPTPPPRSVRSMWNSQPTAMARVRPASPRSLPARPRAAIAPVTPPPATTMTLPRLILKPAADAPLTIRAIRTGSARFGQNGTSRCAEVSGKAANDVVWDSQIQPWLVSSSGHARPHIATHTTIRPARSSAAARTLPICWHIMCCS